MLGGKKNQAFPKSPNFAKHHQIGLFQRVSAAPQHTDTSVFSAHFGGVHFNRSRENTGVHFSSFRENTGVHFSSFRTTWGTRFLDTHNFRHQSFWASYGSWCARSAHYVSPMSAARKKLTFRAIKFDPPISPQTPKVCEIFVIKCHTYRFNTILRFR